MPNLLVDLFATSENYKFPGYVAQNLDPNALARDVFHSRLELLEDDLLVFYNESDVEGFGRINPVQREVRPSDIYVVEQIPGSFY